jgi:hypothetical protein
VGKKENAYRVLVGKLEGYRPFEDQGVDGRVMLKWNFDRWTGRAWTEFIGLRNKWQGAVKTVMCFRIDFRLPPRC